MEQIAIAFATPDGKVSEQHTEGGAETPLPDVRPTVGLTSVTPATPAEVAKAWGRSVCDVCAAARDLKAKRRPDGTLTLLCSRCAAGWP